MTHQERLKADWDAYMVAMFASRSDYRSVHFLDLDHKGRTVGPHLKTVAALLDTLEKHNVFHECDASLGRFLVYFATESDLTAARIML